MKKTILALMVVGLVAGSLPAYAQAAWWKPTTWFKKTTTSVPIPKKQEDKKEGKILTGNEKTITAKIGDTVTVLGVKATITDLAEDSRCAIDVQCIQAGTVRIHVKAQYGIISKTITLTLGQPYTLRGHTITLTSVTPLKKQSITIAPADYVFTFTHSVTAQDVKETKNETKKDEISDKVEVRAFAHDSAELSMMRVQGELYKQTAGNYFGLCKNADAQKVLRLADNGDGSALCNDSTSAWAASISSPNGNYFCVDSTGKSTVTKAKLSEGMLACISK